MNVIACVSFTCYEYLAIGDHNTNGEVFKAFMLKLITHLKNKYQEYFSKIIFTCDEARYHLVKEINDLIKKEEMMMVVTIPYTSEFSFVELFINIIKSKFISKLRK